MGAGQCDLYKGTYGDTIENIPGVLKQKIKFPEDDSQVKHILRAENGHLSYTKENMQLLLDLANDIRYYHGKDKRGLEWSYKTLDDGTQLWVQSREGIIQNGGLNDPPHPWSERTGLSKDLFAYERKRH